MQSGQVSPSLSMLVTEQLQCCSGSLGHGSLQLMIPSLSLSAVSSSTSQPHRPGAILILLSGQRSRQSGVPSPSLSPPWPHGHTAGRVASQRVGSFGQTSVQSGVPSWSLSSSPVAQNVVQFPQKSAVSQLNVGPGSTRLRTESTEWRSAKNTRITWSVSATRPSDARVTVLLRRGWTPPRSMTSLPSMKSHKSSSDSAPTTSPLSR